MTQSLETLRGADEPARAPDVDFSFFADRLRAAFRAMIRKDVGLPRIVARKVLDGPIQKS